MKKILLEIDIIKEQVDSSAFLDHFKTILQHSFSGFSIGSIEMRDSDLENSCDYADLTQVLRFHSGDLNEKKECTFQLGSLSFSLNTAESCNSEFIIKCIKAITAHLDNESFNVFMLADIMNLSKPTLYRKIKLITGLSARDFVRSIKMQIAHQMLKTQNYTVSEVAWKCGYSSARHFSKMFYQMFHTHPSKIFSVNRA
jgi:AraC-like DNA-binding protein